MNSTLTQLNLVQEELDQILDNIPATLQTLKALEIVQHNFADLSQTHLQVKGFIQKAIPQFEQYQQDFIEKGKRLETQRDQAISLNSQLTQKQQDVERELRINHENRWGELRQKFIELQGSLEAILDAHQKQATARDSQLTQKQQEIEQELRTNHENRWSQAQQALVETQNRVKSLTDLNHTLQRHLRLTTLLTWLAFLSTLGMMAWLLYPLYQGLIQWIRILIF